MRPRISIRGSVPPSVGLSIRPSVSLSVYPAVSHFFKLWKSTNLTNLTYLTSLTSLQTFQIWQIWQISLQFYLSPLLQTHLCSKELVSYFAVLCSFISVMDLFDSDIQCQSKARALEVKILAEKVWKSLINMFMVFDCMYKISNFHAKFHAVIISGELPLSILSQSVNDRAFPMV